MRRLIVLCVIFLSILSFPGNVSAIYIEGAVWSTEAYKYALDPSQGPPPERKPDAYFWVENINFDSRRPDGKPKNVSFDEFLNFPLKWEILNPKFSPIDKMFTGTNKEEGIFFQFSWSMVLQDGLLPVTITHDDGFYLFLSDGQTINESKPVGEEPPPPAVSKFDLDVPGTGERTFNLYYGALNDSDDHVLIFGTPEPGSMLLLVLGIIGIGVLRRKH